MKLTVTDFAITPNPNALKFLVQTKITAKAKSFYPGEDSSQRDRLVQELFSLPGVESVFYCDNFITITKACTHAWNHLREQVQEAIEHTDFPSPAEEIYKWFLPQGLPCAQNSVASHGVSNQAVLSPEPTSVGDKSTIMDSPSFQFLSQKEKLDHINLVFNKEVRPALAMDGGGLELVSLENNLLKIKYQGACGSCPSATSSTLQFINQVLKTKISPELQVILA